MPITIGLWFLLGVITRLFCHILVFSLNFHEVIPFFLWKYWVYLNYLYSVVHNHLYLTLDAYTALIEYKYK